VSDASSVGPSGREFEALSRRVESIDSQGSRGVLSLTERVADLTKVVTRLEGEIKAHEKRHETEQAERVAGRRWMVATLAATLSGVIVLLIEQLAQHLH